MAKLVSARDAKNNFGGLLEDVAALGRVDIIKHGRLVAVVLSPGALNSSLPPGEVEVPSSVDEAAGRPRGTSHPRGRTEDPEHLLAARLARRRPGPRLLGRSSA